MTRDQGISWAAGLIEGEGSFHASVRAPRNHGGNTIGYRVRVVMTDRDVVEKLCEVLGVGKVTEYRNTQGLGKKQLYRWETSRRDQVIEICRALYPFMGSRRKSQIDRLLDLLATHPPVTNAERSRRTWLTRHANAVRAAA